MLISNARPKNRKPPENSNKLSSLSMYLISVEAEVILGYKLHSKDCLTSASPPSGPRREGMNTAGVMNVRVDLAASWLHY
jgi:hypothetical protein